jgi:ABC-type multidrug transport system permease subunit
MGRRGANQNFSPETEHDRRLALGQSLRPVTVLVPDCGQISYINPLRFGFEAVLTNEFHTLDGSCATLVPQGPAYAHVSLENQVCAAVGAQPGQTTVNGERFVELSYGYNYGNLWRSSCSFILPISTV